MEARRVVASGTVIPERGVVDGTEQEQRQAQSKHAQDGGGPPPRRSLGRRLLVNGQLLIHYAESRRFVSGGGVWYPWRRRQSSDSRASSALRGTEEDSCSVSRPMRGYCARRRPDEVKLPFAEILTTSAQYRVQCYIINCRSLWSGKEARWQWPGTPLSGWTPAAPSRFVSRPTSSGTGTSKALP